MNPVGKQIFEKRSTETSAERISKMRKMDVRKVAKEKKKYSNIAYTYTFISVGKKNEINENDRINSLHLSQAT